MEYYSIWWIVFLVLALIKLFIGICLIIWRRRKLERIRAQQRTQIVPAYIIHDQRNFTYPNQVPSYQNQVASYQNQVPIYQNQGQNWPASSVNQGWVNPNFNEAPPNYYEATNNK